MVLQDAVLFPSKHRFWQCCQCCVGFPAPPKQCLKPSYTSSQYDQSTNLSIALATPSLSLSSVTKSTWSSTDLAPFPIPTLNPAIWSIERSFSLSPMAIVFSRDIFISLQRWSRLLPLDAPSSITSRLFAQDLDTEIPSTEWRLSLSCWSLSELLSIKRNLNISRSLLFNMSSVLSYISTSMDWPVNFPFDDE